MIVLAIASLLAMAGATAQSTLTQILIHQHDQPGLLNTCDNLDIVINGGTPGFQINFIDVDNGGQILPGSYSTTELKPGVPFIRPLPVAPGKRIKIQVVDRSGAYVESSTYSVNPSHQGTGCVPADNANSAQNGAQSNPDPSPQGKGVTQSPSPITSSQQSTSTATSSTDTPPTSSDNAAQKVTVTEMGTPSSSDVPSSSSESTSSSSWTSSDSTSSSETSSESSSTTASLSSSSSITSISSKSSQSTRAGNSVSTSATQTTTSSSSNGAIAGNALSANKPNVPIGAIVGAIAGVLVLLLLILLAVFVLRKQRQRRRRRRAEDTSIYDISERDLRAEGLMAFDLVSSRASSYQEYQDEPVEQHHEEKDFSAGYPGYPGRYSPVQSTPTHAIDFSYAPESSSSTTALVPDTPSSIDTPSSDCVRAEGTYSQNGRPLILERDSDVGAIRELLPPLYRHSWRRGRRSDSSNRARR